MAIYKVIYDKFKNKVYEGEFEGEIREGRGSLYYTNGKVKYVGEWKNDNPCGMGVLFYENGGKFYEGKWVDGSACGQGALYTDTGRLEYEGQFIDSKKSGVGTVYFKDGSRYKGEWVNDEQQGFGTLYYKTGEILYRGSWRESKKEGTGMLFGRNNTIIYNGEFSDDKKSGRGKSYYSNGVLEYDGEWKDDEKSGDGILYNTEGESIFKGKFIKGKAIERRIEAEIKPFTKNEDEIDNFTVEINAYDENGEDIISDSISIKDEEFIDIDEDETITLDEFIQNADTNREIVLNDNYINDENDDLYNKFIEGEKEVIEESTESEEIDLETEEEQDIINIEVEPQYEEIKNEELEYEEIKDIEFVTDEYDDIEVETEEKNKSLDLVIDGDEVYNYIDKGDYTYKGIFVNDDLNGEGKVFYKEKLRYSGELKEGTYHGIGEIYDKNEKVIYVGNFENGKRSGAGVSYDSIGNIIYEGEWKNDLMHGCGKLLNSNGEEIYSGKFYNGKALGLGNAIEEEIDNILYKELEVMVGLEEVKDDIARLVSFLKVQIIRSRVLYKTLDIPYIFTFEGNRGVGKESVARILGKIYYILGLIPEYNFIQTDLFQALEYSHDGEIEKSMDEFGGGVLYLSDLYESAFDDAFNLIRNKEATNNIIDLIDYSNGHFIIVFSGDEDLIETMIHNKRELVKLVGKSILFFDYSAEEMLEFVEKLGKEKDYELEQDLLDALKEFFDEIVTNDKTSSRNAEFTKELFIELVKAQCIRIDTDGINDIFSMKQLKLKDFNSIKDRICF